MTDTDTPDRVWKPRGVAEALAKRTPNPAVGPLSRFKRYFDALVDRRRRQLLYYLSERRTEFVGIETVARHVTALEVDYAPETLVEAEYAPVQRELYHEHLPRLADDIVEFDPRNEVVRFRPSSRSFRVFLRVSRVVDRLARTDVPRRRFP